MDLVDLVTVWSIKPEHLVLIKGFQNLDLELVGKDFEEIDSVSIESLEDGFLFGFEEVEPLDADSN